jgi:hypothetical protein
MTQPATALALVVGLLAVGAGPAGAGEAPRGCASGAVPAATLLVPYFEVDLDGADGRTTLVAVSNAGSHSTLAHVVLWTDWGLPTLAFDLFLAQDDLQSINLRDVFAGALPATGGGSFVGCSNPLTLPTLDATALATLRQQHTGQPDSQGKCAGSGRGGVDVATGYVTIDVAQGCSATRPYPTNNGYFIAGGTGIASNENLLLGDFFYVDGAQNYAQGNEAVPIVADAARFGGWHSTFYGAWTGHTGDDARAPLGTRYRARYMNGGAFSGGTDFIVWAEPSYSTPQPVRCGEREDSVDRCQLLRLIVFNEEAVLENVIYDDVVPEVAARRSVGSEELPAISPFGTIDVENLIQPCPFPGASIPLQSWVMPLSSASGRFSVGLNASRTGDELCPR